MELAVGIWLEKLVLYPVQRLLFLGAMHRVQNIEETFIT